MKVSFSEHTDIVKAILAGEADAARRLLREHVVVQGDRFSDLVANLSRWCNGPPGKPLTSLRRS